MTLHSLLSSVASHASLQRHLNYNIFQLLAGCQVPLPSCAVCLLSLHVWHFDLAWESQGPHLLQEMFSVQLHELLTQQGVPERNAAWNPEIHSEPVTPAGCFWVLRTSGGKLQGHLLSQGGPANKPQLVCIKMNTLWQFSNVLTCSDAPVMGLEEDIDLSNVFYAPPPFIWQFHDSWAVIHAWSSPGTLAVCGFFKPLILPAKALLTAP